MAWHSVLEWLEASRLSPAGTEGASPLLKERQLSLVNQISFTEMRAENFQFCPGRRSSLILMANLWPRRWIMGWLCRFVILTAMGIRTFMYAMIFRPRTVSGSIMEKVISSR